MIDLLSWCDNNLTRLKSEGISIKNYIACLPETALYSGIPYMITSYSHRNDIPPEHEKESLIAFYAPD